MPRVHVTSEIGALRSVLVHTPGKELVAVTPGTREDYLYDDIIDLEIAQREHRRLVAVLERFAEVHEVRDTLVDIAGRPEVREFLTTRALEVIPSDALSKQMAALSSEDFVALMVEGALEDGGPIARALNEVAYALPPLPNLFFTRDVGIVIREHAIIGSMRHGVRWTEELLIKALFRYDETFANAGILYDGSDEKRLNYTLEGGDVHPAHDPAGRPLSVVVAVVGIGQHLGRGSRVVRVRARRLGRRPRLLRGVARRYQAVGRHRPVPYGEEGDV